LPLSSYRSPALAREESSLACSLPSEGEGAPERQALLEGGTEEDGDLYIGKAYISQGFGVLTFSAHQIKKIG